MSAIRTISRTALGGGLSLARLPLDGLLRLAGDRPPAKALKLAVDRVDATMRSVVGMAFQDEALMDDAERRRGAADERERAVRLRAEAETRRRRSEEHVEERRSEAEQTRADASEAAERQRQEAKQRRDSKKRQAAGTAARRRKSTEKKAARAEERIEADAQRARLEHLETKSDALEEKGAALAAADESRRLRDAASRVKAERKNGG